MFDPHIWQNPDTLMVNLMNTILGLTVVLVAAAIAWKLVRECRRGNGENARHRN